MRLMLDEYFLISSKFGSKANLDAEYYSAALGVLAGVNPALWEELMEHIVAHMPSEGILQVAEISLRGYNLYKQTSRGKLAEERKAKCLVFNLAGLGLPDPFKKQSVQLKRIHESDRYNVW